MQLFPCPFCGPRDESEFSFGAESGNVRPEPSRNVPDERWARYLYFNSNPKGVSNEVWVHLTCGEFFVLERDTVTHAVTVSRSLREGAP